MLWTKIYGKKSQYKSNNKWNDDDTPIKFLSIDIIVSVLQRHFIATLSNLIGEYAIFLCDLSWCNLDVFYLLKPKHSDKVCVQNLPETFGIDGGDNPYINDPSMKCEISIISKIETAIDEKQFLFVNDIVFFKQDNSNQWNYKISLQFLECHIGSLVRITKYEDFVVFLEKIYKISSEKINFDVIAHENKETKLKEVWEIWKKIFGPRFVYHHIKSLTEF